MNERATVASTLSQRALEVLRVEILEGRLKPGEPLRLAALAEKFGFTMSVTREALTKLAAESLVDSSPNQGFRVASVSREDLLDLTSLRVTLEGQALVRSIELGDTGWEARVIAAFHLLRSVPMTQPGTHVSTREWADRHADFHDALGAGCNSPRLIALVKSLRDGAELYRQLSGLRTGESDRDVLGEHRELMELALARDKDAAYRALARHLELTSELLLSENLLHS